MKFTYLADNKDAISTIAQWYFDQWGSYVDAPCAGSFVTKLEEYLNTDSIPLVILAQEGEEVIGAAQLKYREMTIYPEKEHWLGGVYVAETHRGKNVASALVKQVENKAKALGVKTLYLQTENLNGGLYAKLNWQKETQVNYRGVDVIVMRKDLFL